MADRLAIGEVHKNFRCRETRRARPGRSRDPDGFPARQILPPAGCITSFSCSKVPASAALRIRIRPSPKIFATQLIAMNARRRDRGQMKKSIVLQAHFWKQKTHQRQKQKHRMFRLQEKEKGNEKKIVLGENIEGSERNKTTHETTQNEENKATAFRRGRRNRRALSQALAAAHE